ncbi:MAG: TonB family protein [Desulfuromonadales bacterium]|nr:TonB family protein [Desulfuromonadales bacterium]
MGEILSEINLPTMNLKQHHTLFLWGFLILSLLLHLLALQFLPGVRMSPPTVQEKPVFVEIRSVEPRKIELDVEPDKQLDIPRDRPAKRLGPINQVVAVETAPQGDSFEDTTPFSAAPQTQEAEVGHTGAPQSGLPLPPTPEADRKTGEAQPDSAPTSPPKPAGVAALDPKSYLQLADATAVATLGKEARRARRDDMREGEYLHFDLQNDLLSSFFYRFRDNIRMVWNYPVAAGERGQEGVALLGIRINRDGSVAEVKLLRSSGYAILDETAIGAVRRGAPYGEFPSHYQQEFLEFSASFIYQISGQRRSVN